MTDYLNINKHYSIKEKHKQKYLNTDSILKRVLKKMKDKKVKK